MVLVERALPSVLAAFFQTEQKAYLLELRAMETRLRQLESEAKRDDDGGRREKRRRVQCDDPQLDLTVSATEPENASSGIGGAGGGSAAAAPPVGWTAVLRASGVPSVDAVVDACRAELGVSWSPSFTKVRTALKSMHQSSSSSKSSAS